MGHKFLQKQQIEYGIYIVEQDGNQPFNRAMLMTVGAAEAVKQHSDYQCYIFHDVDLLPEDDRNLYTCPIQPRHMSVSINKVSYAKTQQRQGQSGSLQIFIFR